MALLEWRDEFSIGIASVDFEHRELIEFINKMHEHLEQGDSEFTAADFLGELYSMISAHFALEEQTMRQHGYDQFAEHKDDHERLLEEIRDFMDGCEADVAFDDKDLGSRLNIWFSGHFNDMDSRLHHRLGPDAMG